MTFTVTWTDDAKSDLASVWLGAQDRAEVTLAADWIDVILRHDAHFVGRPRGGGVRILYSPPIAIDFEVIVDDRIVRVLSCWRPF